jgi:predicted amidohydrolase YtcJ
VLVDRDVLTVSPDEVRNTKVLWTMVDGRMVYQAKQ